MHKNIYYVFGVHPEDDAVHHNLLGKFYLRDGHFLVLEDHGMHKRDLEEMSPDECASYINSLRHHSQRSLVLSAQELKEGAAPHLIPSISKPGAGASLRDAIGKQLESDESEKVSRFQYHRQGMPMPQELEVRGQKLYLDGYQLEPAESEKVMENLHSGKAQIRHSVEEPVKKAEPKLTEALGVVRQAVKNGSVHPDALKTINKHLFTDTLVPTIGNRMAYKDFLSRPREGVHVHIDMNDFGALNKAPFNYEIGNQAIMATGRALREAMDESVGRKYGKTFRISGDEFRAHVPDKEGAAAFARAFRAKLEGIPAVQGTHRLSASIGTGLTPESAEDSLLQAKGQKSLAAKPKGQAETHVHFHPELK